MSESNGVATLDALERRRGKRRIKEYQWADIGTLDLQSPMSGEWIKIDAARQRARLAAMAGKRKEHEAATQDFMLQVFYEIPLNKDGSHFFTPANKELILSLDPALTDQLLSACIEHAELDETTLGDAQKNLPTTSGSSSPTG